MKKAAIIFTIVLFIFFLLSFKTPKVYRYSEVDNSGIYIIQKEVEVYSRVKISDLVNLEDGVLEDYIINTDKLGVQNIELKYSRGEERYRTTIEIDVYDAKPPYVGLYGSYTHTIGEELKIDYRVFAGDNFSKELKKEIIGEYNLEKEGSYNLKYKVSDEEENVTKKNFTLKVVKPKAKTPGSGGQAVPIKLIPFNTLTSNIPNNASLMIDVSKWQENIDWKKVKDSGVEYAMIRIGTQKEVDQDSVIDAFFERNYKEAKKNGIKVGVYYFSYARNKKDALNQAEWVIKTLNNRELDLPISFDWETWSLFNYFNISFYDLNEIARTFMRKVEESGYKGMNYGSKSYLELVWDIPEYPTWLAHYTSKTTYSKPYLMWQFTSKGEIPGIKGPVDVNYIFNK